MKIVTISNHLYQKLEVPLGLLKCCVCDWCAWVECVGLKRSHGLWRNWTGMRWEFQQLLLLDMVHVEEIRNGNEKLQNADIQQNWQAEQQAVLITPEAQHQGIEWRDNQQLLVSVIRGVDLMQCMLTEQSNAIDLMRGSIREHGSTMRQLFQRIDSNLVNLLRQATNQQRENLASPMQWQGQVDTNVDVCARPMPNPRTLHQPWEEHVNGIENDKLAKHFTRAEWGQFKFKHSWWKIAWDMILQPVQARKTSDEAIELIQAAHGPNTSVTEIIDGLQKCKKNNALHHTLYV